MNREEIIIKAGEFAKDNYMVYDGFVNTPDWNMIDAFVSGATFGYSLSQSELAEKDKRIEELENENYLLKQTVLKTDYRSDLETQLTEANKEITRLKGLIEDAYIQGRNDQISHAGNGWEQFKTENNL